MRFSRRWLAAALALLATLLLTAAAAAADVRGALRYVPDDAFGVIGVDVDALKKSPAFKLVSNAVYGQALASRQLAELEQQTGFDPLRDLHAAVMAFDPKMEQDDDQFVVVLEAKLDEQRVIAFARSQGATITAKTGPHGAYYTLGSSADGAVAFRGKYVIVGGAAVFPKALAGNGGLGKSLTQLDPKAAGRDLFVLARPGANIRKQLGHEHPALGDLLQLAGGLGLQGGLDLDLAGKLATEQSAKDIETALTKALAEVKQDTSAKKLGLDRHAAKVSVQRKGSDLAIRLHLSRTEVDQLLKAIEGAMKPKHSSAPPRPPLPPPPPPPLPPPPPRPLPKK